MQLGQCLDKYTKFKKVKILKQEEIVCGLLSGLVMLLVLQKSKEQLYKIGLQIGIPIRSDEDRRHMMIKFVMNLTHT